VDDEGADGDEAGKIRHAQRLVHVFVRLFGTILSGMLNSMVGGVMFFYMIGSLFSSSAGIPVREVWVQILHAGIY
jgi:hypothetical protein